MLRDFVGISLGQLGNAKHSYLFDFSLGYEAPKTSSG